MNPLERRKNLLEENEVISTFDYSNIKNEDKEILLEYEKEIKKSQSILIKSTLEIGKILYQSNEKLANYSNGTFMSWYQNLGFNKDQVSYFLKRYNLFLNHQDKKEIIAELPVRLVKEITRKDVNPDFVNEVLDAEIKTFKDFIDIKSKYSHGANTKNLDVKKKNNNNKSISIEDLKNAIDEITGDLLDNNKKIEIAKFIKIKFNL